MNRAQQLKADLALMASAWLEEHTTITDTGPLVKLLERAVVMGVVHGLNAADKVQEAEKIAAEMGCVSKGRCGGE